MTDPSAPNEPTYNSSDISSRVKDFNFLLDKIESLDDKKKQLWVEIYDNSITDRANAYLMFSRLVKISGESSNEYAVHARSISSFLERMSRANDQLIKLAELVEKAEHKDETIDVDDMFDQIKKNGH